jgi:DNA-binding NarL/FixJ family response regulator
MGLTLFGRDADTHGMSSSREPVTVVLGHFEDLINRGLRSLLEEDENLEIVRAGVGIDVLPTILAEHQPKVAILNYGSLRSPIEVSHLHQAHPSTRIVVLASRPTPAECNQMLAFGATACLSKETESRDILTAIHLASRGLHVLPKKGGGPSAPMGPELLTPREADVLEHLRQGRSNAEIALALHISIETVRTHRRNIYRKLGVRTRRELAGMQSP